MSRPKDELGARMKEQYEIPVRQYLPTKTPVIIRIDGKAFHTFTKGMRRPFDEVLRQAMADTTKKLCEEIQGCVLGYCQSDEISLVLVDYKTEEATAWFDYEVQKICSVSASIATMAFNKSFQDQVMEASRHPYWLDLSESERRSLLHAMETGAMFDARCFSIPRDEVTNYLYWRELDAMRNSVNQVAFTVFSPKELHGKSSKEIREMLKETEHDWEKFPLECQRGICCIRKEVLKEISETGEKVTRHVWVCDKEIPVFRDEGREYVEQLI